MTALVTCIIPVHNGEAFLRDALDSMAAQSWPDLEIVVVDDGSGDGSRAIAESCAPLVRIVDHRAGSPVISRNLGIAAARGEFLCFLDQDDFSPADRIASQMAAVQDDAADVCVGHVQRVARDSHLGHITPEGPPVPGYLMICTLARRSVFDTVGLLDPDHYYSDSAEWFLRARSAGVRIVSIPPVVTFHREHGANRSLTHGAEARKEFLHLLKAKVDRERTSK